MPKAVASGYKNADYAALFQKYSMATYAPAPVAFLRGSGSRLWDADGKEYVDFAAGVAVCSLGHSHPGVTAAIAEQARTLVHTSNLYLIPNQLRLAQELAELSGLSKAFFCNSGTEAIEAALKLARLWGHKHGGRHEIVSADHSFHGRTLGALSVTNQKKYQEGFGPLLSGILTVPFGDSSAVEQAISPKTAAVIVEPLQGEGGVHVPPSDYLADLRRICDERDVLLILDEVQTGIGRTGTWFAFQEAGVLPDLLALAKGLGSGFPIGALLCNDRANVFTPGTHGSTFGGNPLATAAGLATVRAIREENVMANVQKQGALLMSRLRPLEAAGKIQGLRGKGLLVGFDLPHGDSKTFAQNLLERGLLVTNIHERTIRICPPLVIRSEEIERGSEILRAALG